MSSNKRKNKSLENIYSSMINEAVKKPDTAKGTEAEWTSEIPVSKITTNNPTQTYSSLKGDQSAIDALKARLGSVKSQSKKIPAILMPEDEFEKEIQKTPEGRRLLNYKGTSIPLWGQRQLRVLLKNCYRQKFPAEGGGFEYSYHKGSLMVYGEAGVGKSDIVRDVSKEIARYRKKEWVDWNKISEEEKDVVIQNPEHFFVLMEMNMSELEPATFRGTPKITPEKEGEEKDYSQWMQSKDARFLVDPKADGYLFLDEVLHQSFAKPLLFKLLRERVLGNSEMSPDIAVVAAGNMADGGYEEVDALAKPVRGRFSIGLGVLVADPREWADWARDHGINERIITFALSEPSLTFLQAPDASMTQQQREEVEQSKGEGGTEEDKMGGFISPRTLTHFASEFARVVNQYHAYNKTGLSGEDELTYADDLYATIHERAAAILTKQWADSFLIFLKHWGNIKLEDVVAKGKDAFKGKANDYIATVAMKIAQLSGRVINDLHEKKVQMAHKDCVLLFKAYSSAMTALGKNLEWQKNLLSFIRKTLDDATNQKFSTFIDILGTHGDELLSPDDFKNLNEIMMQISRVSVYKKKDK